MTDRIDAREVMTGGLRLADDHFLATPPEYEWVREGASFWVFEETGAFGFPRMGIEAEPSTWTNRRYGAGVAFADGRVLTDVGIGELHDPFDEAGHPTILGGGPLTFRCVDEFGRWRVDYDGSPIDSSCDAQLARAVDPTVTAAVAFTLDLEMAGPPFVQDTSPANFFRMGKGEQRDAISVGLGWRLEQVVRGTGSLVVDGERRDFACVGMRVKRRSIRTDGLFLRGHCWQSAVFPDGRCFGYLAYPVHDDGHAPWNRGFVHVDGETLPAEAVDAPWLRRVGDPDDDVSVTLRTPDGDVRIEGRPTLSTYRVASPDLWGLHLHQSGARYRWDGHEAIGMLERSATSDVASVV